MTISNLLTTDRSAFVELQNLPDSVTSNLQEQITRLCEEYSDISNCQVTIQVPAFNPEGCYHIELKIALPDGILPIERSPSPDYYQEDLYVAIWSAFNLARKTLAQRLVSAHNNTKGELSASKSQPSQIRPIRRCVGYAKG